MGVWGVGVRRGGVGSGRRGGVSKQDLARHGFLPVAAADKREPTPGLPCSVLRRSLAHAAPADRAALAVTAPMPTDPPPSGAAHPPGACRISPTAQSATPLQQGQQDTGKECAGAFEFPLQNGSRAESHSWRLTSGASKQAGGCAAPQGRWLQGRLALGVPASWMHSPPGGIKASRNCTTCQSHLHRTGMRRWRTHAHIVCILVACAGAASQRHGCASGCNAMLAVQRQAAGGRGGSSPPSNQRLVLRCLCKQDCGTLPPAILGLCMHAWMVGRDQPDTRGSPARPGAVLAPCDGSVCVADSCETRQYSCFLVLFSLSYSSTACLLLGGCELPAPENPRRCRHRLRFKLVLIIPLSLLACSCKALRPRAQASMLCCCAVQLSL